jgi:tetratricopeptide (TPR) repeat protein
VAPAEPSNGLGAGLAALLQSRFVEADEALGRARVGAVAEVAAPASYGLALVAWRRLDGDGFRERATAFVERHPTHPGVGPVLYALVTLALEGGDLDRADAWIKRLVRNQPQSEYATDALVGLATAAQGRPALARQAYRDLLARRPPAELRAEAQLGVAEAALALGDGADAVRALDDFLREAPGDPRAPRAQAMLVRAHQAQGRRDQAIRAAEAFLARFPADPGASSILLTRGQLLLEARRLAEAQRAFETARDRGDPSVAASAQFYLGEVLQAKNEHEAAIAAYLGATYLHPDTPWAAQGLRGAAQSYVSRRMPREAGILLRKLAATPGGDPALAQWARQALAQLGAAAAADPTDAARKGSPPRP